MAFEKEKNIGMTEATQRIGVSSERLRYWELKGIISPHYITRMSKKIRRYSQEDIELCIEIKRLIEEGYTLQGATRKAKEKLKQSKDNA